MRIFHTLKNLQETDKTNIQYTWYYEKEDQHMKDYIEEVARRADNISFNVLPTEEIN